jgi:hypothetical protein
VYSVHVVSVKTAFQDSAVLPPAPCPPWPVMRL